MIRNYRDGEFSPEIIGNVLENPLYRNHLVTSLVNLVRIEDTKELALTLNLYHQKDEMSLLSF